MALDTALMQQVLDEVHEHDCPLCISVTVKTFDGEQIMSFKLEE